MHCFCVNRESKGAILEIGEFEINHWHQPQNRPYPYPRHITRFESQSHRGNPGFGSNYSNSGQIMQSDGAKSTVGDYMNDLASVNRFLEPWLQTARDNSSYNLVDL